MIFIFDNAAITFSKNVEILFQNLKSLIVLNEIQMDTWTRGQLQIINAFDLNQIYKAPFFGST